MCRPVDLRPRTTDGAVPGLPLAAALEDIAYLRREGVTRDVPTLGCLTQHPTMPTRRLSPNGARRTGIISGSLSRQRTRARWPTFVASLGTDGVRQARPGSQVRWVAVE